MARIFLFLLKNVRNFVCQKSLVNLEAHHRCAVKHSANRMANWAFAAHHVMSGICQSFAMLCKASPIEKGTFPQTPPVVPCAKSSARLRIRLCAFLSNALHCLAPMPNCCPVLILAPLISALLIAVASNSLQCVPQSASSPGIPRAFRYAARHPNRASFAPYGAECRVRLTRLP